MTRQDHDFVVVGSGINSLVCATLLARQGHKVCVLERNERPGGCIRTEEITLPGPGLAGGSGYLVAKQLG